MLSDCSSTASEPDATLSEQISTSLASREFDDLNHPDEFILFRLIWWIG